ncbi:MAG: twin-arginine translocase subunit TatC [Candidatus Limnocylindrales bacterium]
MSQADASLDVIIPPEQGPIAEEKTMTLVEHLSELRRRLVISILAVVVGTVIGFILAPQIIDLLLGPLPGHRVQFLTMTGGFMVYLRIALVVGVLLSLPVILFQLWAFVSPGLTPQERRGALPWIPMTIVFFLLGAGVAYFTLPYAIQFLLGFQIEGKLESLPTAEAYFGFVTTIFLIFGAVMQFPIVLVLLNKMGILSVDKLRASRRYVLLGIVIFAVVVTPGGDPYSPIVMSVVMYVLFEFTILLLRRSGRKADG